MWHAVAPVLAQQFTVVVMDLRGYGDSARPASDAAHTVYSKRAMALDAVAVMQHYGFERFGVLAHDRGARGWPIGWRLTIRSTCHVCCLT